ncbi:MAG: cyclic nucleotide-binding domain-containing protein [Desulfobacteraceae bacterium]|jgi:CRP-like cAMP-binding protein
MTKAKPISGAKVGKAVTDFLVSFPFFETLTGDELLFIAEHINFLEIDPGDVLFKEGDPGDCVYFVLAGELDVIKESKTGEKSDLGGFVISTLSKGRSIGEMSVIDKIPRSATVKARTNATLVTLTSEGFDLILEKYPKIGIKILKGVSRLLSLNLRKTSSRLVDYMLPMG